MLEATEAPLWEVHDLAMLDLDGVVYIGQHAVPGAAEHLATAREHGLRLAFITNNASRTPATVAEHLSELDVPANASDVVTSAQAAARVLVDRLGRDAPVVMLGARGLEEALREVGLVPVGVESDQAQALVTGYGPDLVWRDLMHAAVRIRDGLWWVASNTDMSIPTSFGLAPGHGVLVETLSRFSGVQPVVAGKPARPLIDETVRRVGGERPLMVGDRLDTDILGGRQADVDTLLVMTGVTGLSELLAAEPGLRPTYLSADLSGLGHVQPRPAHQEGAWSVGGWTARVDEHADGDAEVAISGAGEDDDWWRAVACAAWAHLDATGTPASPGSLAPPRMAEPEAAR